ncbi:MAG TPA: ATP-dependent metallopeptidase FtsH/Yme1/Tma family protein, partial [Elusimicrobiales bacterium]|nr:ATP-dependent metallopeptidase FtsH/Yme1/Tma family protein [Elusimicrobiales bacterium]
MQGNKNFRQLLFWGLAFMLFAAVYQNLRQLDKERDLPYSEFKQKLRDKQVESVTVRPDLIRGEMREGGKTVKFRALPLPDDKLISDMEAAGLKSF